ncbi:potassium transporter [candidate division LCP-89 bacterium B3_LCP]|uniref:Potassium transporter n=1 Tax=candidate division LCP-89 bacterium B3_LCP TaxID=2012998 RepID=A0A532V4Z3_UNCL8|nr:MAG: potassium transporter [candidate division LCP-89 bacterium B3_LCP]
MKIGPVINFLGALLSFIGAFMLFSAAWALYYGEPELTQLAISAAFTSGIGYLFWRFSDPGPGIGIREGFAIVSLGWLVMALFGALPFMITGTIPSFTNAVFEAMSGFTTTGASILTNIEALPKSILFWRSFTHWLGGMGIIVFSLAILPVLGIGGMQLFKAEAPGPTKDKLTPRINQTAKLLWGVYVLLSGIETVLLMFCGMDLFEALCHTFGTMATGGFSTRNASIAAYENPWVHWVIIIFMIMAGTNFALHYRALLGKPLLYFKDTEFKFYLGSIITAIIIVIVFSWTRFDSAGSGVRDSIFQVVSLCTTTGYVTANYEAWHPLAVLVLIILMFMGGMAGSTGGGMKMMRCMILLRHAHNEIKKLIHPNAIFPIRFGQRITPPEVTTNILGFFLLYIVIFVIGALILSALGLDFQTSFGASIACLANIGPSIGDVGPMGNYSAMPGLAKWILILMMLMGRLELFTVLVLFSRSFWKK